MQYYHGSNPIQLKDTAVACGKFDGLHLGHQTLLNELKQYGRQGLKSTVFTFDASIARIMPDHRGFLLTGAERRFYLSQFGIDILAEYPFDDALSGMDPERFVREVLVGQLGAKAVVVGADFCFGYQRQGDVALLAKLKERYGYALQVVQKREDALGVISSSRIRANLLRGEMEQAQQMLGHSYFILGEVVHGRQLGRTIGMPTANLTVPPHKLLPPNGVYVSCSYIAEEKKPYFGITNVGCKPTVQGDALGVETYLFDVCKDLYGKSMRVELLHYVRPEQRFESVAQLSEQMHRDAAYAQTYVRENL